MLLSLAMLFTLAPTAFATENGSNGSQSTAMRGNCGADDSENSVKWALTDEDGDGSYTLTISGNGAMADFTSPTKPDAEGAKIAPWYTALPADESTSSVPITEIKIDEGVTYLGTYAFSYLTNVVKANIPASITGLGNHIFRGDTALTTVEWASGFNAPEITDTDSKDNTYKGKYVPTSMFDGCTSLGKDKELSAWLPASFTGVGCAAFRGTQFTVNFDGWNTLNYIGAYGFAGMPNLESFTLSAKIALGLRSGASNAFNSSGLKSLTVADGIEAIPSGLCNGCEQLSSVALADFVTTLAMYAFRNTEALKEIDLKNVQTINGYAFQGSGLTALVLPESVKKVESHAFEACTSLTKVTINAAGLTLDNNNTFAGCSALSTVVTSADSKINGLNTGAFGPYKTDYAQAPVENIEINGTVDTLNFSTLASLKSLKINGKNTWYGNILPSGFENLVINGDNWNISGYQFAGKTPIKHLVVSANAVSPAVISNNPTTKEAEAAFRSNSNLETAQFTGKTVELQNKMFLGCTGLNWLDLSTVGTLTVGSSCFGDDTSDSYDASKENPNKFNEDCVIYAKDEPAAQTLRTNLGTKKGIVLVVNGGTVDTAAENAGFSAVTKSGYTAEWHEMANFSDTAVKTPAVGRTYYANWVPRQLSDIEVVAENANVSYGTVLSKDNFKVTAVYDNGEREPVTEFSVSPSTALTTPGTVQVTVTYQEKTATCDITVDKASQAAPTSAPTLKDRTYTSITLNTVEPNANGAVAQYSKDGGKTWQDSAEFTDLTSNTTYTFAVRYAEKAPYAASTASATAEFSTLRHSSGSSSNPTYSVTTPSKSENGKVSLDKSTAKKGDTVTVTVTPDAGYQLDKLTVTDKNGNVLKLTDKGDGKYSFTMPDGKVEVKAVFAKKVETSPFGDVSTDAYYYKAVQWAQEKGITDGISSNLFGPKQPCTRSQIVTFLWRAAGSPEPKSTAAGMTDVAPGSYYAKAVAWAVENGITTGTAEGTFSPDATCTRAQAVTFLARAQNAKATGKTAFSDVPADSYFADAVAWAQANGVTTGTSETTFSPDNDCTRAQIVTFLYRANQGT